VLRDLDIDPDTVLVIRDRELLTRETAWRKMNASRSAR